MFALSLGLLINETNYDITHHARVLLSYLHLATAHETYSVYQQTEYRKTSNTSRVSNRSRVCNTSWVTYISGLDTSSLRGLLLDKVKLFNVASWRCFSRSRISNTSRVSNTSRGVYGICSNRSRGLVLEVLRYLYAFQWRKFQTTVLTSLFVKKLMANNCIVRKWNNVDDYTTTAISTE